MRLITKIITAFMWPVTLFNRMKYYYPSFWNEHESYRLEVGKRQTLASSLIFLFFYWPLDFFCIQLLTPMHLFSYWIPIFIYSLCIHSVSFVQSGKVPSTLEMAPLVGEYFLCDDLLVIINYCYDFDHWPATRQSDCFYHSNCISNV